MLHPAPKQEDFVLQLESKEGKERKKRRRRMKKERMEEGKKKEKEAKTSGIIIPSGSSILPKPLPVQLQELRTFSMESCQEQEGVSLLGHVT